jgi:hypothetical protein
MVESRDRLLNAIALSYHATRETVCRDLQKVDHSYQPDRSFISI